MRCDLASVEKRGLKAPPTAHYALSIAILGAGAATRGEHTHHDPLQRQVVSATLDAR